MQKIYFFGMKYGVIKISLPPRVEDPRVSENDVTFFYKISRRAKRAGKYRSDAEKQNRFLFFLCVIGRSREEQMTKFYMINPFHGDFRITSNL